jgi:uncharacterized protein (TIGR02246 family)
MSAEVTRLNQTWNEAWLGKDVATVESLMTPDYEYVAPNGQVLDRATILAIITSPGYRLDWGTRTEVRLQVLGPDVVAVKHRWNGGGVYEDQAFEDDHRCTTVCVRREGRWLIAHEQCSAIGS